ncbi:MAG: hypothetical protein JW900_06245 [Anaerolineae bacterium]|nr:hypothetical protein [Anaerolineae bacterium]
MKKRKNQQERWIILAAACITVAIVGLIMWGFWRQTDRLQELRAVEANALPLVAYEEQRNRALEERLSRIADPAYYEEWARVHAGLTLPGEVRLVVAVQPEDVPSPGPAPAGQPALTFWQRLWQGVAGDR